MLGVSRGLHAAHELAGHDGTPLQLIHRDVSPQNLMVTFDGVAKVADFGIAKALGQTTETATGILKGKLGYLSPEQLRYEEPDRRSDLFSFGVVFFELLAGRRLYRNRDGMDGVRRILREAPPDIGDERADVPDEIVALLFRLLAKDPAQRPATASEVATILEEVQQDLAPLRCDLGDYLVELFAEQRSAQQQKIERHLQSLDSVDDEPSGAVDGVVSSAATTAIRPPTNTFARGGGVAAVIVMLGLGGLATTELSSATRLSSYLPAVEVPAVVNVTIQSEPSGALVTKDGSLRGYTPLHLLLPHSSDAHAFEIAKDGYQTTTEVIQPNVDQRLQIRLPRLAVDTPAAAVLPPTVPPPARWASRKSAVPAKPPPETKPPRSKGIHRIGAKR